MTMIGLCGLPNCGKDTTANFLIQEYGYSRLSMAQPIREVVYKVFNLEASLMGDREYESVPLRELGGKTVKVTLQQMGKACTDIYNPVWVDNTFKGLDLSKRWVVSDVRRPCEIEQIQAVGGVCIYIHSNRPIPNDGRDMSHESESYHDYLRTHADYHVLNDYESVGEYLEYLKGFMYNRVDHPEVPDLDDDEEYGSFIRYVLTAAHRKK
ncbi:hypothetical protein [Microcoleus phage My-WqHQDG]|nr:hypothetical protein [Microcoleus phage My-WqHQDG]